MSSSIQLDRPHRFEVGDMVRHVDADEHDPANRMIIEAQTLRIVHADGRAYPTYTISSRTYGIKELVEDVLDTEDIVKISYIGFCAECDTVQPKNFNEFVEKLVELREKDMP